MMADERLGPWGMPVSLKVWSIYAVVGVVASLFVMGFVYEITTATLTPRISVSEAIGFGFAVIWLVVLIGPLSPFRVDRRKLANTAENGGGEDS